MCFSQSLCQAVIATGPVECSLALSVVVVGESAHVSCSTAVPSPRTQARARPLPFSHLTLTHTDVHLTRHSEVGLVSSTLLDRNDFRFVYGAHCRFWSLSGLHLRVGLA